MNKILIIFFTIFVLNGCSYEPILSNKNYDFKINKINITGDKKINEIINNSLKKRNKGNNFYDLNIETTKYKNIVSSDLKGNPKILELQIILSYVVLKDSEVILRNNLKKQINYTNIDDKFELEKYEENIVKNLSLNLSNEILVSISTIRYDN
tara:strand:- start:16 stop:474 length:459 start_codon:yes stop_codon:yes gene_type:complete